MSKLEEMLKYVSEHNEFYKNRIKEPFDTWGIFSV